MMVDAIVVMIQTTIAHKSILTLHHVVHAAAITTAANR